MFHWSDLFHFFIHWSLFNIFLTIILLRILCSIHTNNFILIALFLSGANLHLKILSITNLVITKPTSKSHHLSVFNLKKINLHSIKLSQPNHKQYLISSTHCQIHAKHQIINHQLSSIAQILSMYQESLTTFITTLLMCLQKILLPLDWVVTCICSGRQIESWFHLRAEKVSHWFHV